MVILLYFSPVFKVYVDKQNKRRLVRRLQYGAWSGRSVLEPAVGIHAAAGKAGNVTDVFHAGLIELIADIDDGRPRGDVLVQIVEAVLRLAAARFAVRTPVCIARLCVHCLPLFVVDGNNKDPIRSLFQRTATASVCQELRCDGL